MRLRAVLAPWAVIVGKDLPCNLVRNLRVAAGLLDCLGAPLTEHDRVLRFGILVVQFVGKTTVLRLEAFAAHGALAPLTIIQLLGILDFELVHG